MAALLGLIAASTALADAPTVRITKAGQAEAVSDLLRLADFGAGWSGGAVAAHPLTSANCPGFDPKESDLTVTGHADGRFTFRVDGVEVDQDVQVLESAAAVKLDFSRSMSGGLAGCLRYQIEKVAKVTKTTVTPLTFPRTGDVSAAFRATISTKTGRFLSDYVFFGSGRVEYEFTVVAPMATRNQLAQFERKLASDLLKREHALTA